MRRRRGGNIDQSLVGEEENFWPSFADLTSTVALILFVMVLLAYIQNLFGAKQLQRARAELDQTLAQLTGSQKQVSKAKKQLRLLSAELKTGQQQLKLSKEQVKEQAEVIAASNRELEQVKAEVQGIGLLRLSVLEKVRAALERQVNDGRRVVARVAENGNIVLDENLLFDYKSTTIKPQGLEFLRLLAAAFSRVLADPEVRANIDVVAIQGHTDNRGSPTYNRELSAKRASTVLDYMFQAEPSLGERYGRYFTASAYSEFRPVATEDTPQAHQRNRRIEISVVLKDSRVREVIDAYLENQDPRLERVPNGDRDGSTAPVAP
jgi:chemotaxis protein MotB